MNANELDITDFFNDGDHWHISNSVANLGDNAGRTTWENAKQATAQFNILDSDEKRDAFRRHVMDFGAWSPEEIGTWDDTELNALLLQMIAGDIRDYSDETPWTVEGWAEYDSGAERGTYSGRLCRGDDGRVYYYIGT